MVGRTVRTVIGGGVALALVVGCGGGQEEAEASAASAPAAEAAPAEAEPGREAPAAEPAAAAAEPAAPAAEPAAPATPGDKGILTFLGGLELPGGPTWSAAGLDVPGAVSQPLAPQDALAVWKAVYAADEEGALSAVVLGPRYFEDAIGEQKAGLEMQLDKELALLNQIQGERVFGRLESARRRAQDALRKAARDAGMGDLGDTIGNAQADLQKLAELGEVPAKGEQFHFVSMAPKLHAERRALVEASLAKAPKSRKGGLILQLDELGERFEVRVLVLGVQQKELPVHLAMGGFADSPQPAEHGAALQRWQDAHGAKLVFVARDSVEMLASAPPKTLEAAKLLAWEQFLYDPDLLDRGVTSLSTVAKALTSTPVWFFWWD